MTLNPLMPTKKFIPSICEGLSENEKIVCTIENISLQDRVKIVYSGITKWDVYETKYDYDYALTFVVDIKNLKIGERDITKGSMLADAKAKGAHRLVHDIVVNGVLGDHDLE